MTRVLGAVKNYWPFLMGFLINLSVVLYYVIFNHGIQVFHYDMIEQGLAFIARGYDLIRSPGLVLWDWNHFMGANVFVHGFYFLFSPFWLFYGFLSDKSYIPYAALYVNMLKHLILFLSSAFYFQSISKNKLSVYVGASIYTFSGFALGYYNYIHFTDVMLFVPLTLFFVERFLIQHKVVGFTLTIAVMFIINPYLTILFSPYIFIYTLFRYVVINPFKFKVMLFSALKFTILFLLGFGISGLISIPHLQILLSSSRLSTTTNYFQVISDMDLFRYLSSLLQPIVDRNDFNPLISKFIVPSFGHSGGAAVYSLIISPLLVPLLLFMKKSKTVYGLMILYGVGVLFSLFPNLYFLIQGNDDTRWMVYFIFLNGYTVVYILDNIDDIKKRYLFLSGGGVSYFLLFVYFFSRSRELHFQEVYYDIAKRNTIILGIIIILYVVTFVLINRRYRAILVAIIISMESYLALYNIFLNPVPSISMDKVELEAYFLDDLSYVEYLNKIDDGVFRIDVRDAAGFNNSLRKAYMGLSFYSSVYNYNVDPFIQNHIASAGGWIVGGNEGKWWYKMMFGAKYLVSINSTTIIPFGYQKIHTINESGRKIEIFRNNFNFPLFFAQDYTMSFSQWIEMPALDRMNVLLTHAVIENAPTIDANLIAERFEVLGNFSDYGLFYFEDEPEQAILYVEYPRSDELRVIIRYKDTTIIEHYSHEPQYSSVFINQPFDQIEVWVTNLYSVPIEEFINTARLEYPNSFYKDWYIEKQNDFIDDFELSTNQFKGRIELDQPKWIVSSIAYDENWILRINGKVTEFQNVNGGFIGFELPEGSHVIEGDYRSSRYIFGGLISIISLVGMYYFNKKMAKSVGK